MQANYSLEQIKLSHMHISFAKHDDETMVFKTTMMLSLVTNDDSRVACCQKLLLALTTPYDKLHLCMLRNFARCSDKTSQ